MPRRAFRLQLEPLDGRCLLSGNPALFSINDVGLTEGHAGQTALVFTVSLSKARSKPVTVNFVTADGPSTSSHGAASAGSDYVSRAGTLTFAPGERTKTITVLVNGDEEIERHERFSVNLTGAKGALIADAQGIGTIYNDDCPPGMAIDRYTGLPYVPVWTQPDDGGPSPDGPYFVP